MSRPTAGGSAVDAKESRRGDLGKTKGGREHRDIAVIAVFARGASLAWPPTFVGDLHQELAAGDAG
jgi:hypothetical protein